MLGKEDLHLQQVWSWRNTMRTCVEGVKQKRHASRWILFRLLQARSNIENMWSACVSSSWQKSMEYTWTHNRLYSMEWQPSTYTHLYNHVCRFQHLKYIFCFQLEHMRHQFQQLLTWTYSQQYFMCSDY